MSLRGSKTRQVTVVWSLQVDEFDQFWAWQRWQR